MNVLIACEESQNVCIEFRKRGHNAFSCDIQDCSGSHPEWHIKADVLPLLNGYCNFTTSDGNLHYINSEWDLIIAHPPCTYLSKAGACRLFPGGILNEERYKLGVSAAHFFNKILNAKCQRICIENPVPCKIFNLPEPTCIIQPYYFGEVYSKCTYLWLIGLPILFATNIVVPEYDMMSYFKSNSKSRSKTPLGVAAAMASQWG